MGDELPVFANSAREWRKEEKSEEMGRAGDTHTPRGVCMSIKRKGLRE
jgi:hypothetical protein